MSDTPPPDAREMALSMADVRDIVRLLGEVIDNTGSASVRKRQLMDGLCRMIGADAWAWSLVHLEEGSAPRQVLMLHGGFDEKRLALWARAIEHPALKPPFDAFVSNSLALKRGFTRRDVEILPPAWWDAESEPSRLWTQAGFRALMLSAWPLPEGGFSGIGIYRNADRPWFTTRDSRIAHVILSEIPWLHRAGLAIGGGRDLVPLNPRQRTILHLLVQGFSRKTIASDLGIALNTVRGYVKEIYRHFNVRSQAQLITRFTPGRRWGHGISLKSPPGFGEWHKSCGCLIVDKLLFRLKMTNIPLNF